MSAPITSPNTSFFITYYQKTSNLVITLLVVSFLVASAVYYDRSGSIHVTFLATAGIFAVIGLALAILDQKRTNTTKLLTQGVPETALRKPQTPIIRTQIIATDDKQANFKTVTYKHLLVESDISQFRKWLLKEEDNLSPRQAEILVLTVAQVLPQIDHVPSYTMISEHCKEMHTELNRTITTFDCEMTGDWAFYDQEGHYYVDFANAFEFGGGYKTGGCVQEEIMFWMIPQLPHLDFAAEKAGKPIKIWANTAQINDANSFIVHNVRRKFDLRHVPYGLALLHSENSQLAQLAKNLAKEERIPSPAGQGLVPLVINTPDSPPVNIIGLAALDWRGKRRGHKYSKKDLLYHYKAAFFAFKAAALQSQEMGKKAIVHTGAWGCGAFKNSEKTMIFLQLLAASAAGVKVIFHGVGTDPRQPHYTQDFINKSIEKITSGSLTIEQAIEEILEDQEVDSTWRVKS